MNSPKILLIDIETFPNLAEVWQVYETNTLRVLRDTVICCFSAKWLGGMQITKALPDYKYKAGSFDDREIVKEIWDLLNEADFAIAHNGDKFDFKKLNTRFAVHQLRPPQPYRTIDTRKVAKSVFGFDSNKLNELGRQLGHGTKEHTGGYDLWVDCMAGKKEAWRLMKRYNARDVDLLEKVYLDFRPWIKNHPNMGMYMEDTNVCPHCGSERINRRGFQVNQTTKYQRVQCQACWGWGRIMHNLQEVRPIASI